MSHFAVSYVVESRGIQAAQSAHPSFVSGLYEQTQLVNFLDGDGTAMGLTLVLRITSMEVSFTKTESLAGVCLRKKAT